MSTLIRLYKGPFIPKVCQDYPCSQWFQKIYPLVVPYIALSKQHHKSNIYVSYVIFLEPDNAVIDLKKSILLSS